MSLPRQSACAVGLLLVATGCFFAVDEDDPPSNFSAPWPVLAEPLPECTPYPGGFAIPELARWGRVYMEPSAELQPVGVVEQVRRGERLLSASDWDTGRKLAGWWRVRLRRAVARLIRGSHP